MTRAGRNLPVVNAQHPGIFVHGKLLFIVLGIGNGFDPDLLEGELLMNGQLLAPALPVGLPALSGVLVAIAVVNDPATEWLSRNVIRLFQCSPEPRRDFLSVELAGLVFLDVQGVRRNVFSAQAEYVAGANAS